MTVSAFAWAGGRTSHWIYSELLEVTGMWCGREAGGNQSSARPAREPQVSPNSSSGPFDTRSCTCLIVTGDLCGWQSAADRTVSSMCGCTCNFLIISEIYEYCQRLTPPYASLRSSDYFKLHSCCWHYSAVSPIISCTYVLLGNQEQHVTHGPTHPLPSSST